MRRAAALVALTLAACSSGNASRTFTTTAATSTASTTTTTTTTMVPALTTRRPAATGLQAALDAAVAGRPATASVVAVNLATGERGEHLGRRVVLSASLYKLFVAHELFRRIGEGSVHRTDASGDGRHSVDECLRLMIVISDDACGVAGLSMVGKGDLGSALHRDGYAGTFLASPQRTTAADVAEFLTRERAANSELYQLLRQQQVNDRIPRALPPGTSVAHKTGDRTGWAHDAAVISTPKGDVIVAVLTGPWPSPCCHEERIGALERQAFAMIGAIARRIYDYAAA